jgi:hypothetical protein
LLPDWYRSAVNKLAEFALILAASEMLYIPAISDFEIKTLPKRAYCFGSVEAYGRASCTLNRMSVFKVMKGCKENPVHIYS